MSLRSPLGRVLGLGSAKDGAGHWWMQRMTAVALVVLTLWFLVSVLGLGTLDYDAVRRWLGAPVNAVLTILLVISLTYHSQLGIQVVLEDYVAHKGFKLVTLVTNNFLHLTLGALGIFAVLRVALAGGA